MGAVFDDPSVIHDNNAISMANRAEAMGNHQCGAVLCDVHQGALNGRLGVVVDGGCGFIEHQHWCIFEDRSGQSDPLTLATGEALSALSHHRVESLWQGFDEGQGFSLTCRFAYRRCGCIRGAIGNVVPHAAVEQVDVLADQCNRAAQIAKLQLVNGDAIQQDPASIEGVQPQ